VLIREERSANAVPILRRCLEIKEKTQRDDWTTANARSLLGEALTGQKAFQEAEGLLLGAQKVLAEKRDKILPLDRDSTLRDSIDRLVRLYETWGKPAEAEKWKTVLPPAPKPDPPRSPESPKNQIPITPGRR
jgi:eukaryotic-like serine/threonine-protein kinase